MTFAKRQQSGLTIYTGPNFSGRTCAARKFVRLEDDHGQSVDDGDRGGGRGSQGYTGLHGAFVGEDPGSTISGLATSVEGEIALQSLSGGGTAPFKELGLYQYLHDKDLLKRTPFTLSGGEQAMVAICSTLAANRDRIAIDVALEQLSPNTLKIALNDLIAITNASEVLAVLIDNRPNVIECLSPSHTVRTFAQVKGAPKLDLSSLKFRSRPTSITIENLSFRYGRSPWIFRRANLDLNPGQVTHLQGATGAGKSTLSKLLTGLLRPKGGRFLANGRTVQPHRQPGSIFAYHFQNPDHQLFRTSVAAELASSSPRPRSSKNAQIEEIAAAFGLLGVLECHPLDLPYVIRKRLAIAATIAMDRPWLIFDEPTLGQDAESAEQIAHLLQNLAAHGKGVILISHSTTIPSQIHCTQACIGKGTIEVIQDVAEATE